MPLLILSTLPDQALPARASCVALPPASLQASPWEREYMAQ